MSHANARTPNTAVSRDGADIATMRTQPSWPARVAAAPTLPRELRSTPDDLFDAARAATVTAPTLLLEGSESPESLRADVRLVAEAVPDTRIEVLEGQAHSADFLAPELVAEKLLGFLREGPGQPFSVETKSPGLPPRRPRVGRGAGSIGGRGG